MNTITNPTVEILYEEALGLLKRLVGTQSFSGEEGPTADLLDGFLQAHRVETRRHLHNVWAVNRHFDPEKPTVLLNSHHDTVKPGPSWTKAPFAPTIEAGRLYGLGSNDAGGALVSLAATFVYYYEAENLPVNLVYAATAEEETSGANGIAALWPELPPVAFAVVGEPTEMRPAIAEKGLMVLDVTVEGQSGHAARDIGENAIYKAMQAVEWFRTYRFPKQTEWLGPVKTTVTGIQAGGQHNVIPDRCTLLVDVRVNDAYGNEEILETIRANVNGTVKERSTRLQPSQIDPQHPFVQAAVAVGGAPFGSDTLSDQALMPCPSLKMGPGRSERSHRPDEWLGLDELADGIRKYIDSFARFFEHPDAPNL